MPTEPDPRRSLHAGIEQLGNDGWRVLSLSDEPHEALLVKERSRLSIGGKRIYFASRSRSRWICRRIWVDDGAIQWEATACPRTHRRMPA